MDTPYFNTNTLSGTFGGTLLVILLQVNWANLINAAVIAAIGAISSYLVSVTMSWLGRKFFKAQKNKDA